MQSPSVRAAAQTRTPVQRPAQVCVRCVAIPPLWMSMLRVLKAELQFACSFKPQHALKAAWQPTNNTARSNRHLHRGVYTHARVSCYLQHKLCRTQLPKIKSYAHAHATISVLVHFDTWGRRSTASPSSKCRDAGTHACTCKCAKRFPATSRDSPAIALMWY